MKVYRLQWEQVLNMDLAEAWDFFSTPANLKRITPGYMGFDILTDLGDEKMYPGMIINYLVRPLLNIPMNWTTEITHVKDHQYFVDEQRFGPYALWHHRHTFREANGKTIMGDDLHYAIPFGWLGQASNSALVRPKIHEIFEHRTEALERMFNQTESVLAL